MDSPNDATGRTPEDRGSMRFLIVDDSEASRKHLRQIIGEMGHEVVGEGEDGEQAVSLYGTLHPDVVVMDVIMPRLNGIEALQAIRATDPCASVVMTCSLRSCGTAFESQRCGAMYFLTKPFQDSGLRNVIRKLAGHRAVQQSAHQPSDGKPAMQWAASQPDQGQWNATPPAPVKCSDPKPQ
jgi:two-component system, chemotaxis family, chemotaxis protein CheY